MSELTPQMQGRPVDMPHAWAAGLNTLADIQAAIGINSTYTQTYLDRWITADPTCLRIKSVVQAIAQVYRFNTVLITGPSGHGKELLARALHWRPTAPFVPVNCAAMPDTLITSILFGHTRGTFTGATEDRPGVFEAAGPGTVFLDEIGDMPPAQQCALLRVIQEREITRLGESTPRPIACRIVAATNAPEKIRPDLFGRLMAIHLPIPPLSTRPGDVKLIAESLNYPEADPCDPMLDTYGVRWLQALAARKLIGI